MVNWLYKFSERNIQKNAIGSSADAEKKHNLNGFLLLFSILFVSWFEYRDLEHQLKKGLHQKYFQSKIKYHLSKKRNWSHCLAEKFGQLFAQPQSGWIFAKIFEFNANPYGLHHFSIVHISRAWLAMELIKNFKRLWFISCGFFPVCTFNQKCFRELNKIKYKSAIKSYFLFFHSVFFVFVWILDLCGETGKSDLFYYIWHFINNINFH